jgi:hypothetical protein
MLNEAAAKRKPAIAIEIQVPNCRSRKYSRQFELAGSIRQGMNYRSLYSNSTNQILPLDVQHMHALDVYLSSLIWQDSTTMTEKPVRLTELASCAG